MNKKRKKRKCEENKERRKIIEIEMKQIKGGMFFKPKDRPLGI
jgi:hypothetical protein